MTLDEAKKVRELLNAKDMLEKQLNELDMCTTIRAEFSDGVNGIPRRWENGIDKEIEYLKAGYKADITNIETVLRHLASPNFPTN